MSGHLTVKQYRGASSALFSSFALRRGAAAVLALSTVWEGLFGDVASGLR